MESAIAAISSASRHASASSSSSPSSTRRSCSSCSAISTASRSTGVSASAGQVREAVRAIDERGDALGWLHAAARRSGRPGGRVMAEWRRVGALALTPVERLAVEMALHEEQERRALEGELEVLTDAWRDAEEIAAIADSI